jgi:hypothetical protein
MPMFQVLSNNSISKKVMPTSSVMLEAWRKFIAAPSFNDLHTVSHRRDAIRSIIISQRLLGTREIAVYHHTGCGMVTFNTPSLKQLVKDSDPEVFAKPENAKLIDELDFLEFDDLEESVKRDVKFLKESPLVVKGTKVTGWIHHVETGEVCIMDFVWNRFSQLCTGYSCGMIYAAKSTRRIELMSLKITHRGDINEIRNALVLLQL